MTRWCPRCKREKSLSEFGKSKNRPGGLQGWCKTCCAESRCLYRAAHREKQQEYNRRYSKVHKDQERERKRVWRKRHEEEVSEYERNYRATHKDVIRERARVYDASHSKDRREYRLNYRALHKDQILEKERLYREVHKDVIRERHRIDVKRHPDTRRKIAKQYRARKFCAAGTEYTTAAMIRARCEMFGNLCWICGEPMETIDHVKPLSKGGGHWPCNLRPACVPCNTRKKDKWPYEVAR